MLSVKNKKKSVFQLLDVFKPFFFLTTLPDLLNNPNPNRSWLDGWTTPIQSDDAHWLENVNLCSTETYTWTCQLELPKYSVTLIITVMSDDTGMKFYTGL